MHRKFPTKNDQLTPEQLSELFAGVLAYDYCDPAHIGVPLSPQKRLETLRAMSVADIEKALKEGRKRDAQRYTLATGYAPDETIPWKHGIRLITGARYPGTALSRIRKWMTFGILTGSPLEEIQDQTRHPFSSSEIDEFIDHHATNGFTCSELLSVTRRLTEAKHAQAKAARLKNLSPWKRIFLRTAKGSKPAPKQEGLGS